MTVEFSLSGGGEPGLLVMVGDRGVGHTWRFALVHDDQWFRAYWNRDRVGWTLFLTAFRLCFMVERWNWTARAGKGSDE